MISVLANGGRISITTYINYLSTLFFVDCFIDICIFFLAVGYIVSNHQLHTNHLNLECQVMRGLWANLTSPTALLTQLNCVGSLLKFLNHQLILSMVYTQYVGLAAHTFGMVMQFTCNWHSKLDLLILSGFIYHIIISICFSSYPDLYVYYCWFLLGLGITPLMTSSVHWWTISEAGGQYLCVWSLRYICASVHIFM